MRTANCRSEKRSRGAPLVLFAALILMVSVVGGTAVAQTSDSFSIDPIEVGTGDVLISQTDGTLWAYNADAGVLTEHPLPFGAIWDIQWASANSILIANSGDGRIWLLDLGTGALELVAEGDPFGVPMGLALDPTDEDALWVADAVGGILRLDQSSGDVLVVVPPFGGSMDGIVVDDDGTVYFTDLSGVLYRVNSLMPGGHETVVNVGRDGLNGIVFDEAGSLIATASWDPAVVEIDVATGAFTVHDFSTEMRSPEDIAIGSDGSWWVIDSGLVTTFGDDPGLYRLAVPSIDLVELHRGLPLGDTVDLLIVPPRGFEVTIDIKPGSDTNSVNIDGHGVIPVAVLGNESFDVTQIDTATLDFAGLDVNANNKGKVQCSFEDVSGDFVNPEGAPDGYMDLMCGFVDDLNRWNPGEGTATLTGLLLAEYGATAFSGSDSFRLVP